MAHESFEDEEVAGFLNEHFVSIKVDREERPDVDHIYMTVCQALTGSGGWPLTVFMNSEMEPFFAGTYFPKHDSRGVAGLMTMLRRVTDAWKNNREALYYSGARIIEALKQGTEASEDEIPDKVIHEAFDDFKHSFDSTYSGFGTAPKFPTPHNLMFLLRYWYKTREAFALEMVEKTLDSMHRGGIYDHIGWGFSRYSTDKKWLVPHFEKMLYDNALLSIAYLETYQATGNGKYADVAKQIFSYVLRYMTSSEGGFYSAEDADSEGVEGKFYLWSPEEIKKVLGDIDGEKICKYYDITEKGNFEQRNIPNRIKNAAPETEKEFVESCRQRLFDYRELREHPHRDDKILTAWNGLMIAAMAIGGRILGEKKYVESAEKALEFILSKLVRKDGRLLARYRDGESAFPAYVDDYAFLVWGLIELYETTYKPDDLMNALRFNNYMIQYFWDEDSGGLFLSGNDSEQLIMRPKETYDGAIPSGNSVATLNLLRLARLTGRSELEELAQKQFRAFGNALLQSPMGHSFMLTALLFARSETREVVLVANADYPGTDTMLEVVKSNFSPFTLSVYYSDANKDLVKVMPFIENYKPVDGKPTAYVCENFTCQSPTTDMGQLREMLQ